MKILTISNLFPRPDKPEAGLYNYQLFRAMAEQLDRGPQTTDHGLMNVCLVPEWRTWRWLGVGLWHKAGECSSPWSVVSSLFLPVMYFPVFARNWSWKFYSKALRGKRQEFENVDAVFSSWLYPDGAAASMVAEEMKVPSFIMVLGSDIYHLENSNRRKVILDACSKAKGIICVAEHLKKALVEAGVDKGKIHVVDNGVDGEMFKYRAREDVGKMIKGHLDKLGTGRIIREIGDKKVFLFVGNLVSVKNPGLAIDVFAKMVETQRMQGEKSFARPPAPSADGLDAQDKTDGEVDESYRLIVIGDGKERRALERQVVQLGISENVHFLGSRSHDEVALWMNVADCLCLSSRSEGMPNVVIEALTSGLPVVATDVGECRRILADEPNARVVASEDVDMMAKALDDILNMDVDRQTMAEKYKGKYSWEEMATVILERMEEAHKR